MPVPDYQTLMLPLLKLFASGKTRVFDCLDDLKSEFEITDEEAEELLPSGKVTYLTNRANWARTYMGKAGLLHSPKRGHHEITPLGLEFLASNPTELNNRTLEQFPSYIEWRSADSNGTGSAEKAPDNPAEDTTSTPEDAMLHASRELHLALRDDLLAALLQMSPLRFEQLIVDLLSAMGFGRGKADFGQLTPASGDGGIDGIINEDALGLDAVYIQAKRYAPENKVSRPDIQRFVGSLTGESATKGVFVTTSDFSREAREYIGKVQQRIVLISGTKLAQLMIEHDVGVRTRSVFSIKGVDGDYFSEE